MTNREVVLEYLRCFCGGDVDGLEPLIAPGLSFKGTLNTYHSGTEYLDSLRSDPPNRCEYKVLSITENEDSIAVFYDYEKPDQVVRIAQLFKIRDQRIREVLLVFDGRFR